MDQLIPPSKAGANGTIHSITVLPDGKILVGGSFSAINLVSRMVSLD